MTLRHSRWRLAPAFPIGQTYSYDPAPDSLGSDICKYILGVQGNVWAEYLPTYEHAEYMIYPRIIALAEVGWTPMENKHPESFKRRINNEIRYIRTKGYNPFTLSEQVQTSQTVDYAKKKIMLSLTSEKHPIDIRYTTDGSEPTVSSKLYKKPFAVKDSILLTARLFDGEKPIGKSLHLRTDYHKGIGKKITYAPGGGYYQHKEVYKAAVTPVSSTDFAAAKATWTDDGRASCPIIWMPLSTWAK